MTLIIVYAVAVAWAYYGVGVFEEMLEIREPAPWWMRFPVALLWPVSIIGLGCIFAWHLWEERKG
jgi:NADH:ubiquinone oxidoreductase subunit 6 (subunit J)